MESGELSWECIRCHEINEDGFDACWNCGSSKDGVKDPNFKPAVKLVSEPLCKKCGYSLFGLDADRCPECGTTFDLDLQDSLVLPEEKSRLNPFLRLILHCVAVLLVIIFITYGVLAVVYWWEFHFTHR
jgi:RNA polymerase subunit RPABC4/transcription elongation factor Spt4